ncbi:copper resistance CopC family protein [Microbispora sp. CA-102843]|uniref:copper resistance CopC family protein n=1 Tax=Microbispora sp. CA-102843 TaxID=3239952 RepID=UPI003D89EE03
MVAAVLWPVSAAQAHDALRSSNPGKDAKATEVDEVELTFTSAVQFPKVVVADSSGRKFVEGDARVDGGKVTQKLSETLPSGGYTIAYRVVSSDGHPITGEVPFRVVAPATPAAATPTAVNSAASEVVTTPSAPAAPASEPTEAGPPQAASTSGTSSTNVWLLVAGAVVLALAVFLLAGGRKKRAEK